MSALSRRLCAGAAAALFALSAPGCGDKKAAPDKATAEAVKPSEAKPAAAAPPATKPATKPNADKASPKPAADKPSQASATTQPAAKGQPLPNVSKPKTTADTADADLGTLPDGIGLPVGTKVADFTTKDADNKDFTLSAHTAKGSVLLVFYRGGW